MKAEIVKIVTFACMVIVLGMQTLLQGSWSVQETEPVKSKNGSSS